MMEQRIALTITYSIAPGATLDVYPISSITPSSPSGLQIMEVLLTSVPGVSHGTLNLVEGTSYYPWGSVAPNTFGPGAGNDRIYAGEGFEYVNNGTGDGTSETIPVNFRDTTGFTDLSDTIVININSHLSPPTITTQPNTFVQIPPGGTATMSVVASSVEPLSYQWYRGIEPDQSNPIAGATSASYTTPALSTVQQYYYWVQASNADGAVDSETVTVQIASATSVTTSNVSATFNSAAQSVNVSATVNPAENVGNVTYTVQSLGATARSGTVTNGQAGTTSLPLPAGAPVGSYTLGAEYDAPAGIASSTDSKTLRINPASTSVGVTSTPVIPASTSQQNLPLSTVVSSPTGSVNEGTVTLTLMSGSTVIGSPVTSGNVSGGSASVTYSVPGNLSFGTYTVKAVYNPGPDYTGSTATANFTYFPTSFTTSATATNYTLQTDYGGSNVQILINGTLTDSIAKSSLGSTALSFSLTGAGDSFTIDANYGNPIPTGGVTLTGASSGDAVLIDGTQTLADSYSVSSTGVNFDGTQLGFSNVSLLTLNPGTVAASLSVNSGSVAIQAPRSGGGIGARRFSSISVASGAKLLFGSAVARSDRAVVAVSSLSDSGQIDLGANDMIVYGGTVSAISPLLASGFNAGTWTGQGIASAAAGGDSTQLTGLGILSNNSSTGTAIYNSFDYVPVGNTAVLVKYTYYGDANLDGQVDSSDYSRIDNGFLSRVTGWSNGDFNYDGSVNGSDYTLIDNAYNRQGASMAAQIAAEQTAPLNAAFDPQAVRAPSYSNRLTLASTSPFQAEKQISFPVQAGSDMEALLKKKDKIDSLGL